MARKIGEKLITGFIVVYFFVAAVVALNRFWQVNSFWYDLGLFDETVWRLAHFQAPVITNFQINVWGDHLNPSAIILAPLFWFTDRTEVILIAQTAFVCVGAWIGNLISKKHIQSLVLRFSLVGAFLGYVGMQNALITDAHNIVFAVPFLMLLFYAYYEKKIKLYWLSLLLLLGWQENMALVAFAVGCFQIIKERKISKTSLVTITLSIIYGLLAFKVIIPFFRGSGYQYQPQFPPNLWDFTAAFFIPEIKLRTLVVSFVTFGFLPFFSVALWPAFLLHFLERFVLNPVGTRWDLGLHYNSILTPLLFIGSVETMAFLQKKGCIKFLLPAVGLMVIGVVLVIHRFIYHGPLLLVSNPVFYRITTDNAFLESYIKTIPKDGLVMTQNHLATRFAHGKVSLLSNDYKRTQPDVVAFDLRDGQNGNNFFPLNFEQTKKLVVNLELDDDYKKVNEGELIFFKRIE